MVRLARLACLITVVLSISAAPAIADKRIALIIGNSSYKNIPRLDNPSNDAKLMAETLRGLGFTLIGGSAQLDLDKPSIDRVVQTFGAQLRGADVGLFYYAGHGVQVRGANYLVPVDANPTSEADVDFQMLDTNLVLRQMEVAGTQLNLVILDACRNNPFGGRGLRSSSGGLAQMQAPEGTLISYATQPGNVAKDGADGNSPYTKALVQTIRKPGLGIFEAFNEIGLAVMQATGNVQQPWLATSPIQGNFSFAGLPSRLDKPKISTDTPMPDPCGIAADHWRSAEAIGTSVAFEDHLARFPNCAFAGLAKARIASLQHAEAEAKRKAEEERQKVAALPKDNARLPNADEPKASAARVVLYEEVSNDPRGRQYVGSAVWRTEMVSPGPGLNPVPTVRADIEIPERRMTVTWSLRRNTDKTLPASHTIQIMFNVPPDFPGGGISNVPGMTMKLSEQARGTPLAGLAVKVTPGFFLIGLSAVDADVGRNLSLLKERPWFDIPIVYNSGGRAILAMEKGTYGERAFADVLTASGK